MSSFRRRHMMCLALALWLALVSPTSSRAFLTELVVGGALLLEIGTTVAAALPQVALLTTSLLTLAQTSDQIAGTLHRIISFVTGAGSSRREETPSPSPPPPPSVADRPVAPPPPSDDVSTPIDPSNETSMSMEELVEAIVVGFVRQVSLLSALNGLDEGSPEREALAVGYGELVSEQAGLVEFCVTMLLDAIESEDEETVGSFERAVLELDEQQRIALAPVLSKVVSQGRRFAALHGGAGVELFERMTRLHQRIEG